MDRIQKLKELLKEKIPHNSKVGNKKLKEIFDKLSNGKEEIEKNQLIIFFQVFYEHFGLQNKIGYYEYDEKRAFEVDSYGYSKNGYWPEWKEKDALEYILEEISSNKKMIEDKLNYHQFRKAFLIVMLYAKNFYQFELSSAFQITKLTMVKDDPYKRKEISLRKNK